MSRMSKIRDSLFNIKKIVEEEPAHAIAGSVSLEINKINALLDSLESADIEEYAVKKAKAIRLFTFDLRCGKPSEYTAIGNFLMKNGFDKYKDSDYISVEPISENEMIRIEKELVEKYPWFAEKVTKAKSAAFVQDALNATGIQEVAERAHSNGPYEVHGKVYDTIASAASDHGVLAVSVFNRMHRHNETAEEAIDKVLKNTQSRKVTIDGKTYNNPSEACGRLGTPYYQVKNTMIKKGVSFETAFYEVREIREAKEAMATHSKHRKNWTKEDDTIIKSNYLAGIKPEITAKQLDRSVSAVYNRQASLNCRGLKTSPNSFTQENEDMEIEMA